MILKYCYTFSGSSESSEQLMRPLEDTIDGKMHFVVPVSVSRIVIHDPRNFKMIGAKRFLDIHYRWYTQTDSDFIAWYYIHQAIQWETKTGNWFRFVKCGNFRFNSIASYLHLTHQFSVRTSKSSYNKFIIDFQYKKKHTINVRIILETLSTG